MSYEHDTQETGIRTMTKKPVFDWCPSEREIIIEIGHSAPSACELEGCRDPVAITRRLCDFAWRAVSGKQEQST